jgi:AraC-like DNA-binding protein
MLTTITSAYAGTVVYPPGGSFGPRIQQDVQLVMLYTGEMEVVIDGVPHHVQAGTVTLLKPGHEESFTFAKQQETWHRWIAIHFDVLPEATRAHLNALPFSLPLTDEMNRLTDLMLSLMSSVPQNSQLVRSLALAALELYQLGRTAPSKKEKHPAVHQVLDYVRDHYSEEITLPLLAARGGVTPEHLIRLFRKQVEVTPMQHLWRFRIERSKELLMHTGLTVSEVALRCGFKTSHHLAALMKAQTGQTPTQIRSGHWAGER